MYQDHIEKKINPADRARPDTAGPDNHATAIHTAGDHEGALGRSKFSSIDSKPESTKNAPGSSKHSNGGFSDKND